MKKVSETDALEFISPYLGKSISRVWQGNGSSIFLEVGDLTDQKGELTIMIEWSWRVENEKEIEFGSFSELEEFPVLLSKLEGLTIKGIYFQSRLPELVVQFVENIWLCSFSTVEGNPEWALITRNKTLLSSEGSLAYE
jgi:hypothetical protein